MAPWLNPFWWSSPFEPDSLRILSKKNKQWRITLNSRLNKQRIHTSVNERINGVGQIHEESAQQLNIASYFSHKTCHDGNDPSGNPDSINANTTTNNELLIWISCALTSAFRLWPDSMMIKASFRDWLNMLPTFLQLMLIYVAYFSPSPVPDELVKNTRYATVV